MVSRSGCVELDLKAWIGFKCLHPPPSCELWEDRTVIFNTWYQVLDKCLLKANKTREAAMKDTLLSLERGSSAVDGATTAASLLPSCLCSTNFHWAHITGPKLF